MSEHTELEGTWRLVLLEREGKLGPDHGRPLSLRVVGGEFAVKSGDYIYASGVVRIDAIARPRRVDFSQPMGPGRWSTQAGVYEVEGDELRLRLAIDEVPPEGFDGVQGLAIYRREQGEGRP